MNIIKPSFEIKRWTQDGIKAIEEAARTCYLSEPTDTPELRKEYKESESALTFDDFVLHRFVNKLRKLGHQTPFEFMDIEIEFICDRGVSHEQVRHRMTSPMQESTRYCNYSADGKHGLNVIKPLFFPENDPKISTTLSDGYRGQTCNKFDIWCQAMDDAEWHYNKLIEMGATPQEARTVLPNSLKTKLKVKANVREWWHIFKLRAVNTGAHPQIREIMIPALLECAQRWPILFEWLLKDLDTDLNKPARPKTGE